MASDGLYGLDSFGNFRGQSFNLGVEEPALSCGKFIKQLRPRTPETPGNPPYQPFCNSC